MIKEKCKNGNKYVKHDAIPHLCHIELSYACNSKCLFCYNPNRDSIVDTNLVDRIVSVVAKSQIPHVYLIGGEPSLVGVTKLNEYIELLSQHSSVTIVTNGIKKLKGISNKLACFGVPIHGVQKTHEFLNQHNGSFQKTLNTIRYYIEEGHDVRCIPVLTGYNYDQIYSIIEIADKLKMESIYVDRYEDGGIGSKNSPDCRLKPTLFQFREAVTQMLQARKDFTSFNGRIGFGTAIPYCIDERLLPEKMTSNCGVGSSFCAINPKGDFRLCNQSQLIFGNVTEEPIESIWNKPSLDIFRNLKWVKEPCKSCDFLLDCTGGCKVDMNCSNKFCIDYAVRENPNLAVNIVKSTQDQDESVVDYPVDRYRTVCPNRYMKIIRKYSIKFLVTRYQTIKLDTIALKMALEILQFFKVEELYLIDKFSETISEHEVRMFVSRMIQVDALDILDFKEVLTSV